MPDSVFFGEDTTERGPTITLSQLRHAQEICDQCPVARECLTHALTHPEPYGIWAGTSGNAREKILKGVKENNLDIEKVIDHYLENN